MKPHWRWVELTIDEVFGERTEVGVQLGKPGMGTLLERWRQRGKPEMVALVAIMRKLLLQLNAVARRGTPWQPDYQPIT